MKKILSWDCANKSLAWSYIIIDTSIFKDFHDIKREFENIEEEFKIINQNFEFEKYSELIYKIKLIYNKIDNFIKVLFYGVVDLLDGKPLKDFNEVERTKILYKWLESSEVAKNKLLPDTDILIEHQPSRIGAKTNNKSTMIGHQLLFYYADYNLFLVNPKLKNNITIGGYEYSEILIQEIKRKKTKSDASYSARKKHSVLCFCYLMDVMNIPIVSIKKKNIDDLADATMQVFPWILKIQGLGV